MFYLNIAEALASSFRMGEHRDCTVKALSVAKGIPYEDAHRTLKAWGRKEKRGAMFSTLHNAYLEHGFKVMGVFGKTKRARHVRRVINAPIQAGMTLKTFKKTHTKGSYIVCVTGHAVAVVDGVQADSSTENAKVWAVYKTGV